MEEIKRAEAGLPLYLCRCVKLNLQSKNRRRKNEDNMIPLTFA